MLRTVTVLLLLSLTLIGLVMQTTTAVDLIEKNSLSQALDIIGVSSPETVIDQKLSQVKSDWESRTWIISYQLQQLLGLFTF